MTCLIQFLLREKNPITMEYYISFLLSPLVLWLKRDLYIYFMSRKYKFHDNDKLYFISFATIQWIDVFIREEYKQTIIDSWKYSQEKKGLEIYGWCIMTSHIHMIIGSKKDKLDGIVRDMKKHTSLTLRESIKNNLAESRKEWIIWVMERAGKKNGNNSDWSRTLSGATA